MDAKDRQKSRKNPGKAKPLMNLHNNEVGRKVNEVVFVRKKIAKSSFLVYELSMQMIEKVSCGAVLQISFERFSSTKK